MGKRRDSDDDDDDDDSGDDKKRKRRRTVVVVEHKHKSSSSSKRRRHNSDKGGDSKSDKKKHSKRKHRHQQQIANFRELSGDDYFLKNNEFATWLKEERDVFFSDLSSESARELFSKFVRDWNKQKLEPKYYEGIAYGPRTSHSWKIADK